MSCYLCTEQHINYLVSQVENLTSSPGWRELRARRKASLHPAGI